MKKEYEAPKISELGSLRELTQQHFNKVGFTVDSISQQSQVVGSMVPVP